jgi:hypothetical protein
VCTCVAGISLKTQFLYALVFICRYIDLFYNFSSMYNWCDHTRAADQRDHSRRGDGRIGRPKCSRVVSSLCAFLLLRLCRVMKIVFIASSCAIVYLMKYQTPINETYDKKADSFNIWYLIVPCAVLALLINEVFWVTEVPSATGKHHAHHHSIFYYATEVSRTTPARHARTLCMPVSVDTIRTIPAAPHLSSFLYCVLCSSRLPVQLLMHI